MDICWGKQSNTESQEDEYYHPKHSCKGCVSRTTTGDNMSYIKQDLKRKMAPNFITPRNLSPHSFIASLMSELDTQVSLDRLLPDPKKFPQDVAQSQNSISPNDRQYARCLDSQFIHSKKFRDHFPIPLCKNFGSPDPQQGDYTYFPWSGSWYPKATEPVIYLVGNSLGLQSDKSLEGVQEELRIWREHGVAGHFQHPLQKSWMHFDAIVAKKMSPLVGAMDGEVAVCGSLTANLHMLMTAFYRPTSKRFKILYEHGAFPSDHYAFESQVKIHNFDPSNALLSLKPRPGEYTLRTEDILETIRKEGDSIAVVLFSGVQYYTGQFFEIETITQAGQDKGCVVGWDLAHAAGNIPLKLHKWNVDFAAWCTYKYFNAGPGSIGGIFVHERHKDPNSIKRLAGWWGNRSETRFQMPEKFDPSEGASGFKVSNPDVLSLASLYGSLQIFEEASTANLQSNEHALSPLRSKSLAMTRYLELLLKSSRHYVTREESTRESYEMKDAKFTIITPSEINQRGAQLSLLFLPVNSGNMDKVFKTLVNLGVLGDERRPDVIRFTPIPLYNTFDEICCAYLKLEEALNDLAI